MHFLNSGFPLVLLKCGLTYAFAFMQYHTEHSYCIVRYSCPGISLVKGLSLTFSSFPPRISKWLLWAPNFGIKSVSEQRARGGDLG